MEKFRMNEVAFSWLALALCFTKSTIPLLLLFGFAYLVLSERRYVWASGQTFVLLLSYSSLREVVRLVFDFLVGAIDLFSGRYGAIYKVSSVFYFVLSVCFLALVLVGVSQLLNGRDLNLPFINKLTAFLLGLLPPEAMARPVRPARPKKESFNAPVNTDDHRRDDYE